MAEKIKVKGPDGVVHRFDASTDMEQIRQGMAQLYGVKSADVIDPSTYTPEYTPLRKEFQEATEAVYGSTPTRRHLPGPLDRPGMFGLVRQPGRPVDASLVTPDPRGKAMAQFPARLNEPPADPNIGFDLPVDVPFGAAIGPLLAKGAPPWLKVGMGVSGGIADLLGSAGTQWATDVLTEANLPWWVTMPASIGTGVLTGGLAEKALRAPLGMAERARVASQAGAPVQSYHTSPTPRLSKLRQATSERLSPLALNSRVGAAAKVQEIVQNMGQDFSRVYSYDLPLAKLSNTDAGNTLLAYSSRVKKGAKEAVTEAGKVKWEPSDVKTKAFLDSFPARPQTNDRYPMPRFQQWLEELATDEAALGALPPKTRQYVKMQADMLNRDLPGHATKEQISAMQAGLSGSVYPGGKDLYASAKAALMADVGDISADTQKALREAVELRQDLLDTVTPLTAQEKVRKAIIGARNFPQKIVDNVFHPSNLEGVQWLQGQMDPQDWTQVKAVYLRNLIEKSSVTEPSGERRFVPARYLDVFRKNEELIEAVAPEALPDLRDFYTLNRMAFEDVEAAKAVHKQGTVGNIMGPEGQAWLGTLATGGGSVLKAGGLNAPLETLATTGIVMTAPWMVEKMARSPRLTGLLAERPRRLTTKPPKLGK